MAVPSTGAISALSIFREFRDEDYSGTSTAPGTGISLSTLSTGGFSIHTSINTFNASTDRPDGSTPHQMSEFYAYDNDKGSTATEGLLLDDWADGTLGTASTRTPFYTTAFTLSTGTLAPSVHNDPDTTNHRDRPTWTPSPDSPNQDPINGFRLHNTNSPVGMWMKCVNQQGIPSTGVPLNGPGAGTHHFYFRYHFFMNSTNNKDHAVDFRMNTTNHPNPGISTQTYQLQIHDNASPTPGKLEWKRRSGTSVTTLGTAPGAYTLGTTRAIFVNRGFGIGPKFPNNQWRISVGPTTTPNSQLANQPSYIKLNVIDSVYTTWHGINFRSPKAMSTPTSTHYHKVNLVYFNKQTET